jgi:hypothetical protein
VSDVASLQDRAALQSLQSLDTVHAGLFFACMQPRTRVVLGAGGRWGEVLLLYDAAKGLASQVS